MAFAGSAFGRLRGWLPTAAVAGLAGVAGVAGSYLAVGRTPAFVGAPVGDVVTATTPDAVMNAAITYLGDLGHQLAFAVALGLTATLLAAAALAGAVALRTGRRPTAVLQGAALPGMVALALTTDLVSGAGAAAGAGLVVLVAALVPPTADDATVPGRRRLLAALGTALGVSAVASVLTDDGARAPAGLDLPPDARPAVEAHMQTAAERALDVEGLEGLVSSGFYEVDINTVANPDVDRESWTLAVTGAVETEREFTYEDLRAMPREDTFQTLRCVGEALNGRKCDTALWTGVPVRHLLEAVNPQGEYVMLRAVDDYFEEFPVAALRTGTLAYGMNGRDLPRNHGAPVRALVPGHWGEINVKWLDEIEILDQPATGYWEKRGWHGTGPVNTVAKLWQTNHREDGRIEVGGHAYAGTRGIERVEVSTDGGATWAEATLSEPLPGEDVWRQWVHRYRRGERHEVVVRAVDGTGTLQPSEQSEAFPSGPSGWVRSTVVP